MPAEGPPHSGAAAESPSCSLAEARIPEQRIVDGKLFPLVLSPSTDSPTSASAHDALALFKASRAFLEQKLAEHGALFLRGFPFQSSAHFHAALEALGWRNVPYIGSAIRTHVVGSVFTSNESNPDLFIHFHHEMSQIADSSALPAKVVFFCETPPSESGSTPIVVSRKVTEGLLKECPDFMRKLEEQGLLYLKEFPMEKDPRHFALQGWPQVYGTTDKKEAEERARKIFNSKLEWLPGGKMKAVSGPFKATRSFGKEGQNVWFNLIAAYHSGLSKDLNLTQERPYDVLFGDGSPLPQESVEVCRRIHEENSVDIPWRNGDMMIIDNFAVMHGRRPYKPPRRILVSLCK